MKQKPSKRAPQPTKLTADSVLTQLENKLAKADKAKEKSPVRLEHRVSQLTADFRALEKLTPAEQKPALEKLMAKINALTEGLE